MRCEIFLTDTKNNLHLFRLHPAQPSSTTLQGQTHTTSVSLHPLKNKYSMDAGKGKSRSCRYIATIRRMALPVWHTVRAQHVQLQVRSLKRQGTWCRMYVCGARSKCETNSLIRNCCLLHFKSHGIALM